MGDNQYGWLGCHQAVEAAHLPTISILRGHSCEMRDRRMGGVYENTAQKWVVCWCGKSVAKPALTLRLKSTPLDADCINVSGGFHRINWIRVLALLEDSAPKKWHITFFYYPHRGFEIRGGKNPQRTSPCELRHRFPIQINGTGKSIGFGRGFRAVVCTNNFLDVFRSIPGGGIKCPYLNVRKPSWRPDCFFRTRKLSSPGFPRDRYKIETEGDNFQTYLMEFFF